MSDCPEVDEASVRSHMALPGLRKAEADPSHPLKWEEMCNLSAASESQRLRGSFEGFLLAVLHWWHHHGPGHQAGGAACLTALIYVPLMKLWLGFPGVLLTTHAPLICVLLPNAAIWSCLPHYAVLMAQSAVLIQRNSFIIAPVVLVCEGLCIKDVGNT